MAELKPLGRLVQTPSAPDISGAAQAQGLMGSTIQAAAKTVGEFVDAANQVEADAQYTEATNLLNRELVDSLGRENIAQGNAYQRYVAKAQAIKESFLPHVNSKYKSRVNNLIDNQINKLGLKVASEELSYQEQENKFQALSILAQHRKTLDEAIATGDEVGIQNAEENIAISTVNMRQTGQLNALDAYKVGEEVSETVKIGRLKREFQSLLQTDPIKAAAKLNELSASKPDDMTESEWYKAQNELLTMKSTFSRMVDAAETEALSEYDLAFAQGKIKTTTDIANFKAEKEAEGLYVSPQDDRKMQLRLLAANEKENKKLERFMQVENSVRNNPDTQYDMSAEQISDHYEIKSNLLEQKQVELAQANPGTPMASRLAIRSSVVTGYHDVPKSFVREYSDKLQFGTPTETEEAIRVGIQMAENAPKVYSQLPKEVQAYHDLASTLFANTDLPIDQIKKMVSEAVKPKDSARQEMLKQELAKITKNQTYYKNLYKDMYGYKYSPSSQQPYYNNMVDTFDAFFAISGDKESAESLTKRYMRANSGRSQFIPEGEVNKNPIESTPLYQTHPQFVRNQMALGLNKIVKYYGDMKAKGYDVPDVQWPDNIKPISKVNEKDFNQKPLFVDSNPKALVPKEEPLQLKINGKNRPVYLMNPNNNLEDRTKDRREFYYLDSFNVLTPFNVVETETSGTLGYKRGIVSLDLKWPAQLTPNYAKVLDDSSISSMAEKHARMEFRSKDAQERPYEPSLSAQAAKGLGPLGQGVEIAQRTSHKLEGLLREKEYVKTNKKKKEEQIAKLMRGDSK